jgi:ferritin-like metal-binding protein YciE
MASVESLREHLVAELNDLLNAEQQLIEALPQMSEKAASRELRTAFRSHLAETRQHESRVARALKQLGEKASGTTCEAMKGLLEEGEELMGEAETGALRDAMMITAAQKVEHYEIASYGTVRTYAQLLGEKGVAQLLTENLKQEKAADKKLTRIAEGSVNRQAAREWHERSSTTEMLQKGAQWVQSTVADTMKRVMPAGGGRKKSGKSSTRSSGTRGRTTRRSRKSAR